MQLRSTRRAQACWAPPWADADMGTLRQELHVRTHMQVQTWTRKHAARWAPSVTELPTRTRTHKQLQTQTHRNAEYWAPSVIERGRTCMRHVEHHPGRNCRRRRRRKACGILGTLRQGTRHAAYWAPSGRERGRKAYWAHSVINPPERTRTQSILSTLWKGTRTQSILGTLLGTLRKGTQRQRGRKAYWAPSGKERGRKAYTLRKGTRTQSILGTLQKGTRMQSILGTLRKGTRTHKQLQTRTRMRAAYWAHSVIKELQMHAAYSLGTLQEGTADADAACTRLPSLTA